LPPTKNNKTKKTIIRFINRKKVEKTLKNKKKLSQILMADIDLPDHTQLYASENLNSYFRELGWMCRRLKREALIYQ